MYSYNMELWLIYAPEDSFLNGGKAPTFCLHYSLRLRSPRAQTEPGTQY
jgi:hypothetical protein